MFWIHVFGFVVAGSVGCDVGVVMFVFQSLNTTVAINPMATILGFHSEGIIVAKSPREYGSAARMVKAEAMVAPTIFQFTSGNFIAGISMKSCRLSQSKFQ